jgi:hypothetical protein
VGFVIATQSQSARATLQTFTATDIGVGPGAATPNASAAAASFDSAASALAPESTINFESAPVGSFTSLLAAPGVTITGTDYLGNNQSIRNAPALPSSPPLDGFNTTAGGSKFLEVNSGTATFTFASATQFFGAYFTGVQPAYFADTLTFADGTTEIVNITNPSSVNGGVTFVGFTDAGKSIMSITVNAGSLTGGDFIGMDDVRYQGLSSTGSTSASVPEPATAALGLVALPALALFAISRREAVR